MNQYPIDHKFYSMMEEIQSLSREQLQSRLIHLYQTVPEEIREILENYFEKYRFWGSLNLKQQNYELLISRANELHDHHQDFLWLYQKLSDYRSRHLLYAVLNNWYRFDFHSLGPSSEVLYDDYFDMDIIKCGSNEVVVDLGAYTGNTVQKYIQSYGAYRRMYCYEISPKMISWLRQNLSGFWNIELRQKGASDKNVRMYIQENTEDASANVLSTQGSIEVEAVRIDDDIKEPVTLIKMDIEGAEQEALCGCSGHIQNDKPKLAISVYHSHEDLWKIPKMIDEICPGYSFYLRYHGRTLSPTEITLLAVFE